MRAVARKLEANPQIHQCCATVVAVAGPAWRARDDEGTEYEARRAVSCLVEPQVRDRVLLAVTGDGVYVLAVLEREAGEGVVLSATGDMTVSVPAGGFSVAARESVNLVSNSSVSVSAARFDVTARAGALAIQALAYVGEKIAADMGQVKTVAKTVDNVMERFTQRVKRSFRFVEEVDTLQAEQVDHTVKQTYHLRARHALVHSEKMVKMDAESIQLG